MHGKSPGWLAPAPDSLQVPLMKSPAAIPVVLTIAGSDICGRVNPNAGATAGKVMKLRADLSNMHLIDDSTGKVL